MIPWKQNCPHTGDGWCLACVSRLGDAIEEYRANDGSQGRFSAVGLDTARRKLDAALVNTEPQERGVDMWDQENGSDGTVSNAVRRYTAQWGLQKVNQ